jgi:hypothetical protein
VGFFGIKNPHFDLEPSRSKPLFKNFEFFCFQRYPGNFIRSFFLEINFYFFFRYLALDDEKLQEEDDLDKKHVVFWTTKVGVKESRE